MATIDEIKGKLNRLQIARANLDVDYWLKCLKELADDMLIQSYNLPAEEAVRAMGVQKGIGMALMLDKIYETTVRADAHSKILKPN